MTRGTAVKKWGKLVVMMLVLLGAAGISTMAMGQETSPEQQIYDEGIRLLKADKVREAIPLLYQATLLFPGNRRVMADYTIALAWAGEYKKAVAFYQDNEADLKEVGYLHKNIAKAFYELRNFSKARELYALGWQVDPRDAEAFKGLIFSCARLEKYAEAVTAWERARRENLVDAAILDDMKVFLLQHMGASGDAYKTARQAGMQDEGLLTRLQGDIAVNRMRWDEVDQALAILEAQLARNPDNRRAREDYIVALRKKDRMQEVLQQFEIYQQSSQEVPFWVNEAVADAYLYLKQPAQASEYYRLVLTQHPEEPFEPLKGLFYTQVEMRQWRAAAATLEQLEEYLEIRRKKLEGKYFSVDQARLFEHQNNEGLRLRGLFMLYEDRNQQANEYFTGMLAQAGLFTGFRNGLGQALYYQHRPRRALEQFKISHGIDEKDKDALLGMAYALNTLNYKVAARELARELYRKYPTNYHVQNLYETLRVEDRPYLSFDYYFTREFQGAVEHYLVSEFNAALSPTFRIFTQLVWQMGQNLAEENSPQSTWNRIGAGFDWIVVPTLTLRQAVSFDYIKGDEPGSYTKLVWTPDDPWKITAEFDSFSLMLPIRARAADMMAKRATFGVTRTPSDVREYGLGFAANMFSDTNRNYDFGAFFKQRVYNHPDVKVWAGLQGGYSRYTRQDVDYFSPMFVYSAMFAPIIHWIHYHYYDRFYRTSVYPRVGLTKQYNYDFYPVGGLTLEQTLIWSKQFSITANVSYDLRVYDGVYSHVLGAYVGFKKYF